MSGKERAISDIPEILGCRRSALSSTREPVTSSPPARVTASGSTLGQELDWFPLDCRMWYGFPHRDTHTAWSKELLAEGEASDFLSGCLVGLARRPM